jgi:molecular chaperone DnaK
MIADAEQHRDEDARLRQLIDARNELDAVAYQVERRLADLGDRAPTHEKARAEMLVSDARQAIKEEAPLDRLRLLIGELQGVYQGLLAAGGPGPTGGGPSGNGGPSGDGQGQPGGQAGGDDDVIDAEFTSG